MIKFKTKNAEIKVGDNLYKELIVSKLIEKKLSASELSKIATVLYNNGIITKDELNKANKSGSIKEVFGYNPEIIKYLTNNGEVIFYGKHAESLSQESKVSGLFDVKSWKDGAKFKIFGINLALSGKDLENIDKTAAGIGSTAGAIIGSIVPGAGTITGSTIGGSVGGALGSIIKTIGADKAKKLASEIQSGKSLTDAMSSAGLTLSEQAAIMDTLSRYGIDTSYPIYERDKKIDKYMLYGLGALGALTIVMLMSRK